MLFKNLFKTLTLEEEIAKVKREAIRRQMSHSNANFAYMWIASDIGCKKAFEYLYREYIREYIENNMYIR